MIDNIEKLKNAGGKLRLLKMNEEDFSKTAFIQVSAGIGLSDINQDIKYLMNSGYKYVFIDEVTLIEDFIEGAALFSDIFAACGMLSTAEKGNK